MLFLRKCSKMTKVLSKNSAKSLLIWVLVKPEIEKN